MNCESLLSETLVTVSWILLPLVYMLAVYFGYFIGRDAGKREGLASVAFGVKKDNSSGDGNP